MDFPLVSVIIATKNRAHYLSEAIESVLRQEYRNFEIIVVDGGSTDNTEEVAKSYKEVRFILQDGGGIAEAWNLGISIAKGDMIAFIDSDDIWTANKLRVQVDYLLAHPEVQYVVSKLKYFLQPGCPIPAQFRKNLLTGEYPGYLPQSLLARKELFAEIGTFDGHYKIGNDIDWFVRAKDQCVPMTIIPEVLLHRRVHEANTSVESLSVNDHDILELLRKSIVRNRAARNKEG